MPLFSHSFTVQWRDFVTNINSTQADEKNSSTPGSGNHFCQRM